MPPTAIRAAERTAAPRWVSLLLREVRFRLPEASLPEPGVLTLGPDAVVVGDGVWDGERLVPGPALRARAQAVAARTYVLHEAARRAGRDWDVSATATSQVYRGIETETRETRSALARRHRRRQGVPKANTTC